MTMQIEPVQIEPVQIEPDQIASDHVTPHLAPAEDSAGAAGAARSTRSLRFGGRVVPVIGPNVRDPRLHLAVVIVSVITIGTVLLDFRLSIPQIVVTVAVCAVIEAGYRLVTSGALVWPASGMQTATSTVLVLRVVGVEHGDWWSFAGLHWMVGVAVLGLLTKYVVRTRSGHVFNPSNVALVLAFLVFGAGRVEPLDYWWGPFDWRMLLAYAVIVVGGVVIGGRLGLLGMAAACWITLAVGVGVLAVLGHSMTTRWSFAPVAGAHLWRTIVLSPETLIFLFFMITDPKTTPRGRLARVAFGAGVGVVSTLALAPWPTEFGSKVGLLSGLAIMSVVRPLLARSLPAPGSDADRWSSRLRPGVALAAVVGVVVFGAATALAGAPNRSAVDDGADRAVPVAASTVGDAPAEVALPPVDIDRDVAGLSAELATPEGAEALVRALLFNLAVEDEAVAGGDAGLLAAVDHGQRLLDVTARVEARGDGWTISTYTFDTVGLRVVFPGGFQSGPNAGIAVTGTVIERTFTDNGEAGDIEIRPLDTMFTLRRTTGGTWVTTGTLDPG